MAVSIRHRYHYGSIAINEFGVVCGDALTGNKIPALMRDGEYLYRPFGGVIDEDSLMQNAKPVKLVNITGFWWNDLGMGSDGYEIPIDHAVKGYFLNDKYYLAIKNDKPLHWPLQQVGKNYKTDNVFSMRNRKA